jgi:hypothetical protein
METLYLFIQIPCIALQLSLDEVLGFLYCQKEEEIAAILIFTIFAYCYKKYSYYTQRKRQNKRYNNIIVPVLLNDI